MYNFKYRVQLYITFVGIASKSRLCYINGMSGTVFVGMFMIYFHTKFHMPRIGTLLVVVIKPKAELGLQNSRKSHILLNITKKLHEQSHYAGAINNGKFKVQSWALCASCHFTLLINFFFKKTLPLFQKLLGAEQTCKMQVT